MMAVVDLVAITLLAFIAWWFWLYRPAAVAAAGTAPVVEVVVANGVYTPAVIRLPAGRESVLRFLRRDASPCAAQVLIDDLGASAELPLDVPVDVRITPAAPGRHDFTCQMRMYRGTLIVEDTPGAD
jgi:plastocyanin domain-containing protein